MSLASRLGTRRTKTAVAERTIVDAARDYLTVGTPADETPAARKQSATTYKAERIDLDDLQAAASTDHLQLVTDYLEKCELRRQAAKRVTDAGVVESINALIDATTALRDSPSKVTQDAFTAILGRANDLLAYQQITPLRPVQMRSTISRTRW